MESEYRLLRENSVDDIDKNLDRVNPFSGLRLREKVRAHQKRDTFSQEDQEKLSCLSPEYGQEKLEDEHRFWIPLDRALCWCTSGGDLPTLKN